MYSQRLFFLYKLPWNKEDLSLRLQRILKVVSNAFSRLKKQTNKQTITDLITSLYALEKLGDLFSVVYRFVLYFKYMINHFK